MKTFLMTDYGAKMSLQGKNVLTAKDNELIMTTKYPTLKIHSQGVGTHTFEELGGSVLLTTHNLGYRPFFCVWVYDTVNDTTYRFSPKQYIVDDFWYVHYFGTPNSADPENQLLLVNANSWLGGMFDDPTALPNREVNYAWIIYYDPIQDE